MKTLKVGEITVTSLIERDGPWRKPEAMFPTYDPESGANILRSFTQVGRLGGSPSRAYPPRCIDISAPSAL
jgi:hypothetical protein